MKTICIDEKATPGGSYLHETCIPLKTLMSISNKFYSLKKFNNLGINIGHYEADMERI